MSGPIVFISHFFIDPSAGDELAQLQGSISTQLESDKPRTVAFLSYRSEDGARLTIVHVFPDAEAMAMHFEGADERSRQAYELMRPASWEIYGRPDPAIIDQMRAAAAKAGVELELEPDHVAGFMRLGAG